MISENKISKYIALLISETKENKVEWNISSPKAVDSLEGQQDIIGKVYIAEFKEKFIRLYKYSEPIQVDDFEYIAKSFFKLEFTDEFDRNVWTFPFYLRELADLYETVIIKLNELDKYFNDLIPDDIFDF